MHLSNDGRKYREDVAALVGRVTKLLGRLKITVMLYQPDKRRRDIGNTNKALEDALQWAEVYEDDCQIDEAHYYRAGVDRDNPRAEVLIEEI